MSRAEYFRYIANLLICRVQKTVKPVSVKMRPVVLMLLLGCFLWFLREYLDARTIVLLAAILHLLGATPKQRNRKLDFLLTASFSLYTVFLTDQFIRYPLVAILVMGGLFQQAKKMVESKARWYSLTSPGCAVVFLILAMTITSVPNVLLQPEAQASIASEYACFFFRPAEPEGEMRSDGVVIWQDPTPSSFPFNIRPCFAFHHTWLSFLPCPVWPTLKYELGPQPIINISHLRTGHGVNAHLPVPLQKGKVSIARQFLKVYGTFENLPRDNDQLHLRVLVLPTKQKSPLLDKSRKWWVQPHDRTGSDGAELKVIHEGPSHGRWYCDIFLGLPQSQGETFEIMAVVTSRNLKRGERIHIENIKELEVVSGRITVLRE